MIASFADAITERLFRGQRVEGLSAELQHRALAKLQILDAAQTLKDLAAVASNRFELLRGERNGLHCIAVEALARICFRWQSGSAYDVELFGYH